MCEMIHEIIISAPSKKVFEALSTVEGLRSWWTADVEGPDVIDIDSKLLFGFYERETVFRMLVEELIPNEELVWTCFGEFEEWIDTKIIFILEEEEGSTNLKFFHIDWETDEGMFGFCNTTWGMLLYRLRDYVEGSNPGPYFK